MSPKLDPTPISKAPTPRAIESFMPRARMSALHDQPKRRLHPAVTAAAGFAAAAVLLYGAERLAPDEYKPSQFSGAYESEIQEARKSGELTAQIGYEAQLRNVELQHQAQLKQIETTAVQWQEQHRTVLTGWADNYRTAYQRANIYAQGQVDIQKQYVAARMALTQSTLGGEIGVANTVSMLGLYGGLFSPEFGQSAMNYAEQVRGQALRRLDDAARSGVTVTVEGWNTGLPDPDEFTRQIYALPPLQLPGFEPTPITVPAVAEAPSSNDEEH